MKKTRVQKSHATVPLKLTKGNVDDRVPVPELTKRLTGIIAADKGQ